MSSTHRSLGAGLIIAVAGFGWSDAGAFDPADTGARPTQNRPATVHASGVCLDEARQPLENVRADLYRTEFQPVPVATRLARVHTDSRGRYTFDSFPALQPGDDVLHSFMIVLTVPGKVSQYIVYHSAPPAARTTIMPPAATLSGLITDPEGKPVADALVFTQWLVDDPFEGAFNARSGADGRFEIADIEPFQKGGEFKFRGPEGEEYTARSHGKDFLVRHPRFATQRVTVTSAPGRVDIRLNYGGTVEGRVVDAVTNRPAAGTAVVVTQPGGDGWRQLFTDEQGSYRVVVGEGDYTVWASGPDRTCVALTRVPVVAQKTTRVSDLNLIEGGWIEGRLVGPGVKPLTRDPDTGLRLCVRLNGPSRPQDYAMEICAVDDEGRFRMRVAPGLNYPSIGFDKVWQKVARREEFENGIEVRAGETVKVLFRVLSNNENPVRPQP